MNLFRRLDATTSPTLAAPAGTTARTSETTAGPDTWIPAPKHPEIWAALAAVSNNNGVIDQDAPGLTDLNLT